MTQNTQEKPSQTSSAQKCAAIARCFTEILCIALIMVPNTMYYASVNALSQLLLNAFNDQNIITASSLLHSIPSIFCAFGVSFFTDVLGVEFMLLPLQMLIIIGCLCSAFSKSSSVFLIGRLLYGLCGEGLIMVQARLISNRIPPKWHPFAFSLTFCGFMLGESIASILLGKFDSIVRAYLLIAGCMTAGLIIQITYTILEIKRRRKESVDLIEHGGSFNGLNTSNELESRPEAQHSLQYKDPLKIRCKKMFTTVTDSIKTARPLLWIMVVCRLLFMGTKMGFDSTSVLFFSSIFHLDNSIIVSAVGTSQISAAVSFLLVGFLVSFWKLGPIVIITCGYLSLTGALMTLYFANGALVEDTLSATRTIYLICIFIGISFGLFASNTSAVIVSLSDKAMSASGLGLVFSFQFLIMSIVVPLGTYVANISSYRIAVWVYIAMLYCAAPFLLSVFIRLTLDYVQNKKKKKQENVAKIEVITSVLSVSSLDGDLEHVL